MSEMMYTYVSPDGEIWWSDYHETMEQAYQEAVEMYGDGVLIRKVWYKEWVCGFYELGQQCGYDKYGNHVTAEEKTGGERVEDFSGKKPSVVLPVIDTLKSAAEKGTNNG